jgi:AcrR family transcriptional regulator
MPPASMRKSNQIGSDPAISLSGAFSNERLCKRIFERHRATIKIQKPRVAIANLVRIIEATLRLSNRHGFHAMTLRELAKTSGLSMGSLYSYFDNKETLLSMILGEVSATVIEVLNTLPAEVPGSASRHLDWLIGTHIRLTDEMRPWFTFVFMEAKAFPVKARRMAVESEASTERIFAAVLERGKRSGEFQIGDVGLTAALIKPVVQDWYVKHAKYRKRGVSVDQFAAAATRFLTGATGRRTRR